MSKKQNLDSGNDDALFAEAVAALDEPESNEPVITEGDDAVEGDADDAVNAPADEPQEPEQQEAAFDYSTLPEPVKTELEQLRQYRSSNEGRVSALQRKIDGLNSDLQTLQQNGQGNSQAANDIREQIKVNTEDLDSVAENFPEFAPLVATMKAQQEKIAQFEAQNQQLHGLVETNVIKPAAKKAEEDARNELIKEHNDFAEIESNKAFWNWLDEQPQAVRNMAQSSDVSDVSYLVSSFKKSPAYQPKTQQKPSVKIDRKLEDMQTLPSGGNARGSQVSGDDDALFNHFAGLVDTGKL